MVVQADVFGEDTVAILPELALAFGEGAGDQRGMDKVGVAEIEDVVAVELIVPLGDGCAAYGLPPRVREP